MKNKGLIFAFSCVCIFVVALITTIIVLASGNQNVGSNLSLIYVASEIGGSVSGTYKVGNNDAKDMTNGSGAKVVSFGSDQPETLSLLSPNETKVVSKKGDLKPGKYTVLTSNEGEDKFNIRVGNYVREYAHNQSIILSEGQEVTAINCPVILR